MEKIIKEIENWEFLSQLPPCIEGFALSAEPTPDDSLRRHRIFTYENNQTRRSFSVLYEKSTKEYLARTVVGLTEFCDISYMAGSLAKLEELLGDRLEKTLRALRSPRPPAGCDKDYLGVEFLQKKILDWPYAGKLPGEVSGFELFISPREPVKVVNGSYIIIDYSDFELESGLTIYYNIFRDEFFGEMKLRRTPVTTAEFDAKTLPELEEKINLGLKDVLASLRSEL